MKLKYLIVSLALLGGICHADDTPQLQPIGPFGGLNTNISQEAIDATQSPDLLNVDITPGGKSVKKRQGYGTDATFTVSTSAVHNLYKFFDSSGNEVRLAFNDNRVNASVNGAPWSVILTTGTVGATWDCTDYLGFAYCVSSAFDNPIKTNGTSAGTTGVGGTNAVPAGSLVSNSGDRLLVGATSANPSRIYYSASASFSDFSLGIQPSNSSFEDIVAPGSKLTHLSYHFGRWLWWKDQSFGFIVGTGQFDLQIIVVSNTIGTFDNTDVYDGNYVYFRGSDGQFYTYDGSVLSRSISTDIFPTINSSNRRKANQWQQTSQTDFNAGSSVPTANISTTISVGDITVSSFSAVNTLTFSSMSYNFQNLNNNSFESGDSTNWTNSGYFTNSGANGGVSPQDGSFMEVEGCNLTAYIVNAVDASTITSTAVPETSNVWTLNTLTIGSSNAGKLVYLKFYVTGGVGLGGYLKSDNFVLNGNNVQFYSNHSSSNFNCFIDNITNTPKSSSQTYTSSIYDTGFASGTATLQDAHLFSIGPIVGVQTSTSATGVFSTLLTSTGTNAVANRFIKYSSTYSFVLADYPLVPVSTNTLIVRSTGTYYSAVNNAPNLTSWSTLGITDSISGNSTITYYSRASTGSFTVLSSTPGWVLQAKNATVSASTGPYMQFRADFAITAATENPTVSDFTFNWFEGVAADKMYGTYFKNGIWFALSVGTSTSVNNRIFRYDLLSNLWTLYDINSNGFLTYNNNLYFGDPSAGKIYRFANNVYSDNGSAINAYWKSKAFFGDSPFTDKDLRMASWYVAEDSGTTLSITYTLNESTTVARSLNLYDSRKNVIQNNWNFPLGSVATNFNVQFGDTSSNAPWEVFGTAIYYVPRPWKVSLQ